MYIFIIVVALILLFLTVITPINRSNKQSIVGVLFVFLIVFIGTFRDTTVGTDIGLGGGYHDYWQNPAGYERNLEPGFKWLTYFIKSISGSYYFYYSFIFLLNILFYYLACKKMKVNFPLFLAIAFLSSLLTPSFNVIRQMLGLSIGLYLYSILYYGREKNRKSIVIYEVSILLSSYLIHTSVVLLGFIPIIEIPTINRLFSKTWFLSLVAIGCVLLSKSGASHIIQYVMRFSGFFGERADFYIDIVDNFEIDRSHGFVTDAINFVLVILLSRGCRNDLFKIGFLGYVLSCLSAATLGVIGRAFDNLLIFSCLYYTQNWNIFIPVSKQKVLTLGAMLLRVVFWLTGVYYTVLLNESLTPYKNYLF